VAIAVAITTVRVGYMCAVVGGALWKEHTSDALPPYLHQCCPGIHVLTLIMVNITTTRTTITTHNQNYNLPLLPTYLPT
jgi:hypothetical protein